MHREKRGEDEEVRERGSKKVLFTFRLFFTWKIR